jgi:hypothetical protein
MSVLNLVSNFVKCNHPIGRIIFFFKFADSNLSVSFGPLARDGQGRKKLRLASQTHSFWAQITKWKKDEISDARWWTLAVENRIFLDDLVGFIHPSLSKIAIKRSGVPLKMYITSNWQPLNTACVSRSTENFAAAKRACRKIFWL